MNYKYDLFISYKNSDITNDWVSIFKNKLEAWLTEELGGIKPKIFFDEETIETGDNWPIKLQEGIKTSRCLVCIWTAEYFQSKWCVSEWRSFEKRKEVIMTKPLSKSIIHPLKFYDGDFYPKITESYDILDVTQYTYLISRKSLDTPTGRKFQDEIKKLSKTLANSINSAPDYCDNFPIHIATDEDIVPPNNHRQRLNK